MTDPQDPDKSMNYRIRVAGKLKQSWSDWFNGMTIEFGNDTAHLDQLGACADYGHYFSHWRHLGSDRWSIAAF